MKHSLPNYDEALATIQQHVEMLGARRVSLDDALGAVLRQDIVADRDHPPFDRATMDGFAARSNEIKSTEQFNVHGDIPAGSPPQQFPDTPLQAIRIATGAPLPQGADCIIPIEQAKPESKHVRFNIDAIQQWENVHLAGADAKAGQVVVNAGSRIRAQHLAIAATMGADEITVAQPPCIILLTSGDEVIPHDTPTAKLQPQQIRNSNGPMLIAFFADLDTNVHQHRHLPDDPAQTLSAVRQAISNADLVITVGGVSIGQRDLFPDTCKQLGLQPIIHGVAIQPGKPLLVAKYDQTLIVELPGNPVSVLATAHLFIRPIIRKMLGQPDALPWRQVTLGAPNAVPALHQRQVFRAAKLLRNGLAKVIEWHGSGDLIHTAYADGLVRLPQRDEPVAAGVSLPFLPFAG